MQFDRGGREGATIRAAERIEPVRRASHLPIQATAIKNEVTTPKGRSRAKQ